MTIISVSTITRNPAVAGDGLMMPAAAAAAAPYAAAGPLIAGTSHTPNSIDTVTNKTFTIQEYGRSFFPGARLRASAIGFTDVWLEGTVTAWDGQIVTIDGDLSSGTGTYSNWGINVTGEPGTQGPIGPTGPIGPSGGPAGPQGPAGTPGAVWRNGNGVPANSLGANGDYYLDDLTGDVYYRSSSVYSLVSNIEGSAGAAGAPGPTGPTGPQGIIPEPPNDNNIYSRRVTAGTGAWVIPPGGGDVQHTITLTAGAGLAGGGDLSANRTFAVGAGTGITVNADDVALTIPVAITSGGTGATSAAAALTALGAAPLASPTFTGDPKAPTPSAGDNDVSIATTAFVTTALSTAGGTDSRLQNLGLAVSAAGSALTIALKGANGSDPSASNPVIIDFRNATLTTGTPTTVTVTAATSLVLASGNTMGIASATAFRLWIVAFNNGGTVELGAINCAAVSGTATPQIFPLSESILQSSSAASGNLAVGVFATTTARSNLPIRILGYIEWNASGLTAGTWTITNLRAVQLFGPGVKKPGERVQLVGFYGGAQLSTTSASYVSTNSTVNITPVSAANFVNIKSLGGPIYAASYSTSPAFRIYRGSVGIGAELYVLSPTIGLALALFATDRPNSASATTYVVKFQSDGSNLLYYSGAGTVNYIEAEEIMA